MKSQENQLKIKFMKAALKEAKKAELIDEVPVGAVVVFDGKIIARAHNTREKNQAFYAHAEFLAMMKAAKKIGSWRLEDCDVYVTMEPCAMCAGAMIQSRVKSVYYGAKDIKSGVVDSLTNIFDLPFNHHVQSESDILADESSKILKDFFKKLRVK
ncbi:MAG: tRNA-specific adenosine deaminase [Tenericutes bacterium HGW-Tenericutes-3]|nr:MAG: tRNA-specific adenosine deaminase [Tenericutes bacterium HGW-Tenericutes-3]